MEGKTLFSVALVFGAGFIVGMSLASRRRRSAQWWRVITAPSHIAVYEGTWTIPAPKPVDALNELPSYPSPTEWGRWGES